MFCSVLQVYELLNTQPSGLAIRQFSTTLRLGCLAGFHMTLSSQHSNVSSGLWWNTDSFNIFVHYLLNAFIEQHFLPK